MNRMTRWLFVFAATLCAVLATTTAQAQTAQQAQQSQKQAVSSASESPHAQKPKIALIVNCYTKNSHADVIGTKFMEGFPLPDGKTIKPSVQIVSLWIDQSKPDDLGHQLAAKHDIPVYDSIKQASHSGATNSRSMACCSSASTATIPTTVSDRRCIRVCAFSIRSTR